MQQQQDSSTVRQLLDEARHALDASNAQQALQCVAQALKLLHGDSAVLPALKAAAERYHAQQAAPIHELSQLLAQVSIAAAAESQVGHHQQQHFQPHQPQQVPQPHQQHHQQHPAWDQTSSMQWQANNPAGMQQQPQQVQWQHQGQQQAGWGQQQHQGQQHVATAGCSKPILEETGRGSFTDAALADGSSWRCPHCSGVVPQQRQQAHLAYWCPASTSGGS